jgi:hypothetical protein
VTYGEIISLDECGLINSGGLVSLNLSISPDEPIGLYNRSRLTLVHTVESNKTKLSIGEFGLTRAGKELFHILDVTPNDEYINDFAEYISKKQSPKVKVTIHRINYIDEGGINYDKTVLREFPAENEEQKNEEQ